MLTIHHFRRGPLDNNMFLLVDESNSRAAVVDPGIDSEDILSFTQERGYSIELVINTHAHFDHVYNNGWFAARTGAPIALHPDDLFILHNLQETCQRWGMPVPDPSPEPSILLQHGAPLDVFGHQLDVRHTPGHCPGQVCLYLPAGLAVRAELASARNGGSADCIGLTNTAGGDELRPYDPDVASEAIAIVGDTLFRRGVGRWDLPGASWEALERSITDQLYTLPDDTLVLCGHGDFTTIGEEKRHNPYVGAGARLIPKV